MLGSGDNESRLGGSNAKDETDSLIAVAINMRIWSRQFLCVDM